MFLYDEAPQREVRRGAIGLLACAFVLELQTVFGQTVLDARHSTSLTFSAVAQHELVELIFGELRQIVRAAYAIGAGQRCHQLPAEIELPEWERVRRCEVVIPADVHGHRLALGEILEHFQKHLWVDLAPFSVAHLTFEIGHSGIDLYNLVATDAERHDNLPSRFVPPV